MGKGNGGSLIYSETERERNRGIFYIFIYNATSVVVHKHQTKRDKTGIYKIIKHDPYLKASLQKCVLSDLKDDTESDLT